MGVAWEGGADAPKAMIADRHLYLDKDGTTVVEEGDVRSASQFVAKGHPIARADAARLGLVLKDGRVVQDRGETVEAEQSAPAASEAKKPAAKKSSAKKPSEE